MTENQTSPKGQEPPRPPQPQQPPFAFGWPPQGAAYNPAQYVPPPKDDIPDKPPVDEKIGKGFLSIIPRVLRLRDAVYFDIKDDKMSYKAIGQMALVALACFMIYGFVMGTYNHFPRQSISSMIKLPVVFLISLLVCLLPLYLIGILLNLRLYFRQIAGLFIMGVCATSLVAVCMAPITAFCLFTVKSTMRYNMIMMVNVIVLGIAGFVGVAYVLRGSRFMAKKREQETGMPMKSRRVLWLWMLVYALVGIQLAWELRPYMGREGLPFELKRSSTGDFYSTTVQTIGEILRIVPTAMERSVYRHSVLKQAIVSDRDKVEQLNKRISAVEEELKKMEENPPIDQKAYEAKKAYLKDLQDQLKELQDKINANKEEKEGLEKQYNLDENRQSD